MRMRFGTRPGFLGRQMVDGGGPADMGVNHQTEITQRGKRSIDRGTMNPGRRGSRQGGDLVGVEMARGTIQHLQDRPACLYATVSHKVPMRNAEVAMADYALPDLPYDAVPSSHIAQVRSWSCTTPNTGETVILEYVEVNGARSFTAVSLLLGMCSSS